MFDSRIIYRLVYDGNISRAVAMLAEIVEKQQKEIEELKKEKGKENA